MRFICVFLLMFFSIFGLAMLIHVLANALICGGTRRFDVTINDSEDIEEFIRQAEKSAFIGSIGVISEDAGRAAALERKYDSVHIVTKQGR